MDQGLLARHIPVHVQPDMVDLAIILVLVAVVVAVVHMVVLVARVVWARTRSVLPSQQHMEVPPPPLNSGLVVEVATTLPVEAVVVSFAWLFRARCL
jgi:hypothetical protein